MGEPSSPPKEAYAGQGLTDAQFKALTPDQQAFMQSQAYNYGKSHAGGDGFVALAKSETDSKVTNQAGDPLVAPKTPAAPPAPDLTDALVKAYQYGQVQKQITGSRKASMLTDATPLSTPSLPAPADTGSGKKTLGS